MLAAWIAFSPMKARAEWARTPVVVTSTRIVPLQPPSMPALDGSPRIARSAASISGWSAARRPEPVEGGVDLFVIVEHPRDVAGGCAQCAGDGELHGHARLHVARSAAPDDVLPVEDAAVRRQVVLDGDGVEVARDQDALVRGPEWCAR